VYDPARTASAGPVNTPSTARFLPPLRGWLQRRRVDENRRPDAPAHRRRRRSYRQCLYRQPGEAAVAVRNVSGAGDGHGIRRGGARLHRQRHALYHFRSASDLAGGSGSKPPTPSWSSSSPSRRQFFRRGREIPEWTIDRAIKNGGRAWVGAGGLFHHAAGTEETLLIIVFVQIGNDDAVGRGRMHKLVKADINADV